jgi:shikimate 5-dehydrogenase
MLVKTPQGVKAFNSDFLGVRMWLEEVAAEVLTEKISVLIVGLGGAGKAAAAAAESLGMKVVRMNRTVRDEKTRPLDDFKECFKEADIIIYNIPTVIQALNELTDKDFTPGKPKFIMEANYKDPSFGKEILAKIQTANPLARYTGGKTWLLYQAVTGYEIFTGEKPDLAGMYDVL